MELFKTRISILIFIWIGLLILITAKVGLLFLQKKRGHESVWIRNCLSVWYQALGSFILVISLMCGYAGLWVEFGISLAVGIIFFIRGFFEQFIEKK